MDTIKSLLMVIPVFFILSTQAIGETNSFIKIPSQTGTILLEKGVCDTGFLKNKAKTTNNEHRYVVVKFDRSLKRKTIKDLEKGGINLLLPLHKNAWVCSVAQPSLSEKELNKYAIAAMAPWKAEYKILPALKNGHFQEWAVTEEGNIKLLVSFFSDVDRKDVELLLAKYSIFYENINGPDTWAVQVPPTDIESLINEPVIHFVEEGPRPDEHRLMFCIGLSLLSIKYKM